MPDEARGVGLKDVGPVIPLWKDDEVERLRILATAELRQRGLLPPEPISDGEAPAGRVVRQRTPEVTVARLAPGRISVIHAASRAGIRPSKIAQEFGVPLATVKRVIAVSTAS